LLQEIRLCAQALRARILLRLRKPGLGFQRTDSMDGFYKNLSIMGGFLLLHITGAGQYSIDALCGIAAR